MWHLIISLENVLSLTYGEEYVFKAIWTYDKISSESFSLI